MNIVKWMVNDPHQNGGGKMLPEWFKMIMIFIDRVGFPIFVAISMMGGFFYVLTRVVPILEKINENLSALRH